MDADEIIRSAMASQTTALVVVMISFLSTRMKRIKRDTKPVLYGPRLASDEYRQKNLKLIYNSTDIVFGNAKDD
jgi:hypothetical protein